RRRHTRFSRDWSSDVCSSDLPIAEQLNDIDQVSNLEELYDYFVKYGRLGGNPFFGAYVYAHMKNSNMNAVYLGGGGLGLGRSYYQKEDERSEEHTSELQSRENLVCRLLLEKKKHAYRHR